MVVANNKSIPEARLDTFVVGHIPPEKRKLFLLCEIIKSIDIFIMFKRLIFFYCRVYANCQEMKSRQEGDLHLGSS